MPRVVICLGSGSGTESWSPREPDVPGERPRRLSPVVPRGRDVSSRGLLALCQILNTNQLGGQWRWHWAVSGASESTWSASTRRSQAILRSPEVRVRARSDTSGAGWALPRRHGPTVVAWLAARPPQPDLTERHCAVPPGRDDGGPPGRADPGAARPRISSGQRCQQLGIDQQCHAPDGPRAGLGYAAPPVPAGSRSPSRAIQGHRRLRLQLTILARRIVPRASVRV